MKNFDMAIDFRVPRHKIHAASICSDASKLPINLTRSWRRIPTNTVNLCLRKLCRLCCDAFSDLHTCAEQQWSGCLNLTSVNCVRAIEAKRDKSKRERRMLFAV